MAASSAIRSIIVSTAAQTSLAVGSSCCTPPLAGAPTPPTMGRTLEGGGVSPRTTAADTSATSRDCWAATAGRSPPSACQPDSATAAAAPSRPSRAAASVEVSVPRRAAPAARTAGKSGRTAANCESDGPSTLLSISSSSCMASAAATS